MATGKPLAGLFLHRSIDAASAYVLVLNQILRICL